MEVEGKEGEGRRGLQFTFLPTPEYAPTRFKYLQHLLGSQLFLQICG